MSRYSKGVFCYLLTFSEIRIGNSLIICYFFCCVLFIIMNRVTDSVLSPVSIECNALCYRFIPVIRTAGLICLSKPSLKCVVCFCWIRRLCCIEPILICLYICFACLAICIFIGISPCTSLHVKGYLTCREPEVSVQGQTCRHFRSLFRMYRIIIRIGILVLRVGKPAKPLSSIHWSSRFIASQITGNAVPECDLLCAYLSSVIIVERQRILHGIVIEVRCHRSIRSRVSQISCIVRSDPTSLGISCIIRIIGIV